MSGGSGRFSLRRQLKLVFLGRRLAAEGLGTAALLAVVVGSGIRGERLSQGNAAIALLANSLATGCGLFVLIVALGPISGAYFNPAVSFAPAGASGLPKRLPPSGWFWRFGVPKSNRQA
jgi:glycerol uptake facilitator-like aquaporin